MTPHQRDAYVEKQRQYYQLKKQLKQELYLQAVLHKQLRGEADQAFSKWFKLYFAQQNPMPGNTRGTYLRARAIQAEQTARIAHRDYEVPESEDESWRNAAIKSAAYDLAFTLAGIGLGRLIGTMRASRGVALTDDLARATNQANDAAMAVETNAGSWMSQLQGTRIKRVGNYWIKEVDPDASGIMQWWARGSLDAQASALSKLGNMAPPHILKGGKLVIRNAGSFSGSTGEFLEIWAKGSIRLRTPFNDIRPWNVGSDGLIFDPALHPIHEGVYWGATGFVVVAGGTWVYYEVQASE